MKKSKNILKSFGFAFQGIGFAFLKEKNLALHLVAATAAIAASIYFQLDRMEFLFVITAIFMVFVTEMVNTAVEAAVDLSVGEKYHPLARAAKNIAAGAVLFAAFFALLVAFLVFGGRVAAWL